MMGCKHSILATSCKWATYVLFLVVAQVFEALREDKNGEIDARSKDFIAIKVRTIVFVVAVFVVVNSFVMKHYHHKIKAHKCNHPFPCCCC